jgi:hypothetical protein
MKRVKLNKDIIISGKIFNGKEIASGRWDMKDITKIKMVLKVV